MAIILQMKRSFLFKLMVLLLALLIGSMLTGITVSAQGHDTPYGDYHEWCGAYGICREDMSQKDAEMAIERYFSSKGLRVGRFHHRGRFVEADIYRDSRMTDRIIFDRKTGRMRSVY